MQFLILIRQALVDLVRPPWAEARAAMRLMESVYKLKFYGHSLGN